MRIRALLAAGTAVLAFTLPAVAQDSFIGSYTARLSDRDHFSSTGKRLDTAAQVVRQDRANWHRFERVDDDDDGDPWFADGNARARLERMLNKSGAMDRNTSRYIMNAEPIVRVDVYRNSVRVTIVGR